MDEIVELFNEVFSAFKVYASTEEVLKDRYPYIKKWQRQQVGKYVTVYMTNEPAREPFRVCPNGGEMRRVHPESCEWHRQRKDPRCAACGKVKTQAAPLERSDQSSRQALENRPFQQFKLDFESSEFRK